jgi:hypothetical protein
MIQIKRDILVVDTTLPMIVLTRTQIERVHSATWHFWRFKCAKMVPLLAIMALSHQFLQYFLDDI